jgi:hypothetical protein
MYDVIINNNNKKNGNARKNELFTFLAFGIGGETGR